jgi:Asp-tRNA(Asn)/Glu-tRNA(Gln) amidotransferase C subunit
MEETYDTLMAKLEALKGKDFTEEEKQQLLQEIENFVKFVFGC